MANPQKENGHVAIANEVLEALLRFQFHGNDLRVLLAIIRKTWGWGKKEDWLSVSQLSKMTGIAERQISQSLASLRSSGIISRDTRTGVTNFVKDWEVWTNPAPQRTPALQRRMRHSALTPALQRPKPLRSSADTKDTLTKATTTKENNYKGIEAVKLSTPTPAQDADRFFNSPEKREPVISMMMEKLKLPEQVVRSEMDRFVMYWTEPERSGKRVRWEREPTFEVRRRLVTWFSRAIQRSGSYSSRPAETKGIRI
jgi:phage replication O-like protein O